MNKILALILTTVILASMVPVMADVPYPTQATVPAGGVGDKPVVKAKWEVSIDDDPTRPWTQFLAPGYWEGVTVVTYWTVVTDYDGWDNIDASYVDVYHPDNCMNGEPREESFKYQVELIEVPICDSQGNFDQTTYDLVVSELMSADSGKAVAYGNDPTGAPFDAAEVAHELLKCSAKAYVGTSLLDYHQMCGEFEWTSRCVGTPPECEYEWTPIDMSNGYLVRAYAFDKNGLKSDFLDNRFEYICEAGIEVDFLGLDFENVLYKTHKWIEGDSTFDLKKGPACRLGAGCVAPTIRNTGNIPVAIGVEQDDMGFGFSGPPIDPENPVRPIDPNGWNVQWDARLGEGDISIFKPYEPVVLDGILDLCETDQISFSIYVKKPMTTGLYEGNVELTPLPVSFPWWTCDIDYHNECSGLMCMAVPGTGPDQCQVDFDCDTI